MKPVHIKSRTERQIYERSLDEQSIDLPFTSRLAFADVFHLDTTLLAITDDSGLPVGGAALLWERTRALPGFSIIRVQRLGGGLDASATRRFAEELTRIARRSRVLTVYVETCLMPENTRAAIIAAGFQETKARRSYAHTSLIDLTPAEDAIFRGFKSTARSNIRTADKKPVRIAPVADPQVAPRMASLFREAFDRTGTQAPEFNPLGWLSLARAHPDHVCVIGMFNQLISGPESLLGFVIAIRHGRVAEYSIAASTRNSDLKLPILYAPTWRAMQWAKAAGATLWDFGGITAGTQSSEDPRGGISDFKRYFAGSTDLVGYEFQFEPSALRSRVAGTLRTLGRVRLRIFNQ